MIDVPRKSDETLEYMRTLLSYARAEVRLIANGRPDEDAQSMAVRTDDWLAEIQGWLGSPQ